MNILVFDYKHVERIMNEGDLLINKLQSSW